MTMLDQIETLAAKLAEKDSKLRIAFNEADKTTAAEPEAQRFLKLNESRLGRDFKVYDFMAKVAGEQDTTVTLLEELVLPLQRTAPEAYAAGLSYLREQSSVFGPQKDAWEAMIDDFMPKAATPSKAPSK